MSKRPGQSVKLKLGFHRKMLQLCLEWVLVPSPNGRPSSRKPVMSKTDQGADVRKKTAEQEDHFITLSALRNRRLSSRNLQARFARRYDTWVSDQTIRNRLHAANLHARKAARKPAMTALQRRARFRWCQQHVRWNRIMWHSQWCSATNLGSAYGRLFLFLTERNWYKMKCYARLFEFMDDHLETQ